MFRLILKRSDISSSINLCNTCHEKMWNEEKIRDTTDKVLAVKVHLKSNLTVHTSFYPQISKSFQEQSMYISTFVLTFIVTFNSNVSMYLQMRVKAKELKFLTVDFVCKNVAPRLALKYQNSRRILFMN